MIGLFDAGQDLDEGGFSGAIFPDQGMDLTLSQFEIDILEGDDAWEEFGNFLHHNNILSICHRITCLGWRSDKEQDCRFSIDWINPGTCTSTMCGLSKLV